MYKKDFFQQRAALKANVERRTMVEKFVIGCQEWCALPDLGLLAIKARADSGAKTSVLHAINISTYIEDGREYARFGVHPIQGNREMVQFCTAPLVARRVIRSSNGLPEQRLVITTTIQLGSVSWEIEVTLTNRDYMGFRMLLGREAMRNRVLVDPDAAFITRNMSDDEAMLYYAKNIERRKALNIVLLASNPDLYSNKRILEAGQALGHNITFVNVSNCYINIMSGVPAIYCKGNKQLQCIDAVIPRLKPSMTFYGCALLRQFQTLGAFCLNDAVSISNARDKLKCLQILADKGINLPITSFASSLEDTKHLIKAVGGAPVIIKLLEGTQGKGVVLAETEKAAASVIGAFKSVKANILVQEFVKEAKGEDIRCFVIAGKVVAAMQRKAAEGDFRSNLHLGGTASQIKLSQYEKKMALSAVKSLGLKIAGVDIIRSYCGPKVLEVNASPGLEGIEAATGKDIASMIIHYIEKHI